MPAAVLLARIEQFRLDQLHKGAGLRAQELALAHHDAVAARREPARQRARGQPLAVGLGQADRGDDADAQPHRHVLLDHLPATDFQRHRVRDAVLLEHQVDQPVRGQAFRRQDQAVGRQVLQRQIALGRQRMLGRHDQHRLEAVDRRVGQVRRHIQHRAHGQVHRIVAQQIQPAGAGDVVQAQAHIGMALAERVHDPGQQVQDGRAAGGHVELAGVQPAHLLAEAGGQPIQPFHQRLGQFVEQFALAGRGQPSPAALQQAHAEFALQCLQLQGHRRLAQVQRFRGTAHRSQARDLAERPQRLEPGTLVGEAKVAGCPIHHGFHAFYLVFKY